MADVVVDASVVAKWYIPERDHDRARALRDDYLEGRHDLLAPALLPFEVINALKYSGHYDGDRLAAASQTLPEYGVTLVAYRDIGHVATVASELDVTIYDAAYIGLASARDATAYTADAKLIEAVDESGYASDIAHIRTYEA